MNIDITTPEPRTTDNEPATVHGKELVELVRLWGPEHAMQAKVFVVEIEREAAERASGGLDVERLASVLHDASCQWRAHSGFLAKSDKEHHQRQASLILARLTGGQDDE